LGGVSCCGKEMSRTLQDRIADLEATIKRYDETLFLEEDPERRQTYADLIKTARVNLQQLLRQEEREEERQQQQQRYRGNF
jgi:hypothetical protein